MQKNDTKTRRAARRTGLSAATAGLLFAGLAVTQCESASALSYSSGKASVKNAAQKARDTAKKTTKWGKHTYSRVNARRAFSEHGLANTLMERDFKPMLLSTWQRKFKKAEEDDRGNPANLNVALIRRKSGIWVYQLRLLPGGKLEAKATHRVPREGTLQPAFVEVRGPDWADASLTLGSANVRVLATHAGNPHLTARMEQQQPASQFWDQLPARMEQFLADHPEARNQLNRNQLNQNERPQQPQQQPQPTNQPERTQQLRPRGSQTNATAEHAQLAQATRRWELFTNLKTVTTGNWQEVTAFAESALADGERMRLSWHLPPKARQKDAATAILRRAVTEPRGYRISWDGGVHWQPMALAELKSFRDRSPLPETTVTKLPRTPYGE